MSNNPPFFSVITVCYQNLDGLKRTQQSLQHQSCKDYEWIVIDGGSDDGTANHLKGTGALWISEPDRGIYDAMNKGMDRSGGHYLIFMNAGDLFANDTILQDIFDSAQGRDFAFIYGDSYEEDTETRTFYKPAKPASKMLCGMITHHQSMFYERQTIGHQRYNLDYKISADYDFTLRILKDLEPQKILHVPKPICIFESGGISQRKTDLGRQEQFMIRKKLKMASVSYNCWIMGLQFLNLQLRRFFPALYWFLKQQSSHNNDSA